MARIRTIKPEFQRSQSMGRCSRDARLAFIELWPQADDTGRLPASSRMLASLLFPYDDDAPRLIDGWLAELAREGCVVRYTVNGDDYLEITNFLKHQRIDHPSPSRIPAPDDPLANVREDSAKARECSSLERKGKDQGREGIKDQGPPRVSRARNGWDSEFAEFWSTYPLHVGKRAAYKAFGAALKRAEHPIILAGAQRYCQDPARKPDYTKHPATWLNADGWLDEPVPSTHSEVQRLAAAMKAKADNGGFDDYR